MLVFVFVAVVVTGMDVVAVCVVVTVTGVDVVLVRVVVTVVVTGLAVVVNVKVVDARVVVTVCVTAGSVIVDLDTEVTVDVRVRVTVLVTTVFGLGQWCRRVLWHFLATEAVCACAPETSTITTGASRIAAPANQVALILMTPPYACRARQVKPSGRSRRRRRGRRGRASRR